LLPISTNDAGDNVEQLEKCLLEACKEVGTLLFRAGRPDEGWAYLQPVGDQALAKRLLMEIPVTHENQDLIIDLGLGQGIAPAYAFEIMLKAFGTCDAITAIDMRANQGGLAPSDLRSIAEILLESFYDDLLTNVRKDVAERNGQGETTTETATLGELLDHNAWLVSESGLHVDTSHLNSVVRIARNVGDEKHFRMAKELCQYGQRLADEFKYSGDPPFEIPYVDHERYFGGLLNEHVDDVVQHFQGKLDRSDAANRTLVAEQFVALLVRLGRSEAAVDLYLSHLAGEQTWGIAPSVHEIADSPELKQRLVNHFQASDDLLGFAISKLQLEQKP